jgi:2-polyprenyl-3-methyl-5-hydroxy-6-metoxy-1,4-benzoquinol methylase
MAVYSDEQVAASWDEGAAAWDAFVESGADYYRHEVHGPALLEACNPQPGEIVLDLGSGQGFFSRELARRGAHVTGIEISPQLVVLAAEHEARDPLGIEYQEMSAAAIGEALPRRSFDLVTACMSLQDMADVSSVLGGAAAVLRPSGRLVFSVPHPATDTAYREWERDASGGKIALKLDRYFEAGAAICHWSMPRLTYHWSTPCWRHTLSDWSAMLTTAGFAIEFMREPRPTAAQLAENPKLEDCARMPFFLIFGCRRK